MEMKAYARIINDVIMMQEERPPSTVMHSTKTIVTSGGRLQQAGWLVSTVVNATKKSVSFSVQLPGGRDGYTTDILAQFVTEETIRAYAEHALAKVLEQNNYKAVA